MNRLATQPTTPNPSSASPKSPIALPLDDISSLGQELPARISPASRPAVFCPLHYEQGYAYPLIVWLHAAGQTEHALRHAVSRISLRNYVAVGPRGTISAPAATCDEGSTWSQDADHLELAEESVLDAVDFARAHFNISPDRIFLAGEDAGGTMALRLAFQSPRRFAGAISVNGLLPRQGLPLCRVNELRHLPVLLSIRVGQALNLRQLEEDERLLHAAGTPYSLQTYQDEECVTARMLSDLDRWMNSVVCPARD